MRVLQNVGKVFISEHFEFGVQDFFFPRSDVEDFPETDRVKVVQLVGMLMVDSTGYRGLQPR